MRTDTQRLDWILAALDSGNEEPIERLQAAYTLELRGRPAMDAAMGAKVVEPGEPMPALTAIDLAIAEVGRIRNVKGFSEERDDGFHAGFLDGRAAAYLLAPPNGGTLAAQCWVGPWSDFKPSPDDRKKELTKGIALALCELDRLIRAERRRDEAGLQEYLESPEHKAYIDNLCEPEDAQPQPREFKVGDRVKCMDPGYSFGAGALGTITRGSVMGGYEVAVDAKSGAEFYFTAASMEHADD